MLSHYHAWRFPFCRPYPPAPLPYFTDMEPFAEMVRRAICDTFIQLDNEWMATGHTAGER